MQVTSPPRPERRTDSDERRGNMPVLPSCFGYQVYGLHIASQLELPELLPSSLRADRDVDILTHALPVSLKQAIQRGSWIQLSETRCQMTIPRIARYRMDGGRRIVVDRRVDTSLGCDPGDVRLYLLGTAFGTLLHQRQWLPLHVSALATPSGAWAFTGASGAGKSTLAAWLHHDRGWPLISDDVAVVKPEETRPWLYPGPPRLKLWKDALAMLGIGTQGLVRDLSRADKYHLIQHRGFQAVPLPLTGLVVLERAEPGEHAVLEKLHGVAAFQAVMASLYRPELARAFQVPQSLMRHVADLAQRVQIYRFRRPLSLHDMTPVLSPLIAHIAGAAPDDV